jgi:hypothetical protein
MNSIPRKLKKRQKAKKSKSSHAIHLETSSPITSAGKINFAFTTTGEIFQPIRVHYNVKNQFELINEFIKLQCIDHDSIHNRWVWLYVAEARKIQFAKQPPKKDVIIIGEFILKGKDELVLNLRSIERALEAIVFFDQYLSRNNVSVTDITMINRLFDVEEVRSIKSIDYLFERSDVLVRNPDKIIQQLTDIKSKAESEIDGFIGIEHFIQKLVNEPEPEIEKFPSNYHEDGIDPLKFALAQRQKTAIEHWKGNTKYTAMDAIMDMLNTARPIE